MKSAKHIILIPILVVLCMFDTEAQEENLIPNPSFEEYSGVPLGWFYNGNQFSRLIKYWYSPTLASPDVFGPEVIVPQHWKKKGFGDQKPFDGNSMIGITVYGCAEGKPHCREYIQSHLNESLVVGQKYKVSYWIAHLEHSLFSDKIGVLFTKDAVRLDEDSVLPGNPQVYSEHILQPSRMNWKKEEGFFTADSAFNFITIGNFYSDDENKTFGKDNKYKYAYYYLDKIELVKVPPIIQPELPKDDLSLQKLELGKKIELKNIYFDLDKSDLLPKSYVELNKLRRILQSNESMSIEVHGHTDIQGEFDYNIDLSLERAKAVCQYLIDSGITPERIAYKGFGSNQPIADNSMESGRKMNRRVEFLITAL
jgi:outer membrane protein OmpA-like peptidoglycan-associated protein